MQQATDAVEQTLHSLIILYMELEAAEGDPTVSGSFTFVATSMLSDPLALIGKLSKMLQSENLNCFYGDSEHNWSYRDDERVSRPKASCIYVLF